MAKLFLLRSDWVAIFILKLTDLRELLKWEDDVSKGLSQFETEFVTSWLKLLLLQDLFIGKLCILHRELKYKCMILSTEILDIVRWEDISSSRNRRFPSTFNTGLSSWICNLWISNYCYTLIFIRQSILTLINRRRKNRWYCLH